MRWHIWTIFALSVLAGIGTQAWGRGHWLFFGTRLAVAAGIGAALLAIFVAPRVIPVPQNADAARAISVLINAVALTGVLGAGAGILTLLQPNNDDPFRPWWSLGVLVFVAADLAWAAQGLNPTVPAAFYDRQEPQQGDSRAYWPEPPEDHQAAVFETYLLFDDYRVAQQQWQAFRASQTPDLNLLDRQYLLNNFDPLQVGYFAQYLDLIEAQLPDADALLQAANTNALFDRSGQRIDLDFPVQRAWLVNSACWHLTKLVSAKGFRAGIGTPTVRCI